MGEAIRAGFPFDYDQDAVSLETGLRCDDESLADQSAKDEADINVILTKFGVTGVLPQTAKPLFYADFDGVFDFQSAQNVIAAANQAFMSLPADVRARFLNDPQKFVEYCSEAKPDGSLVHLAELREMGLAPPEKVPTPTAPDPVAPSPSVPSPPP